MVIKKIELTLPEKQVGMTFTPKALYDVGVLPGGGILGSIDLIIPMGPYQQVYDEGGEIIGLRYADGTFAEVESETLIEGEIKKVKLTIEETGTFMLYRNPIYTTVRWIALLNDLVSDTLKAKDYYEDGNCTQLKNMYQQAYAEQHQAFTELEVGLTKEDAIEIKNKIISVQFVFDWVVGGLFWPYAVYCAFTGTGEVLSYLNRYFEAQEKVDTYNAKYGKLVIIEDLYKTACDVGNNPPVISDLSADPPSVDINQTTTITCFASDPDGDPLSYHWTKNGGSFEGDTSGSSVTWKAPSTLDTYTIECEVSDGEGGEDNDSVNIVVTESEEQLPATVAPIIHIVYGVADGDGIVNADELGYGLAVLGAGPAYAEIKIYINDICAYIGDVLADGSWWAVVVSELDVDGAKTLYATATEDGLAESAHSNEITFILDTTGSEENDTYTITASAGSHGSISPSGSITVNQGSDKSFTITPDTGYSIDDVLVDGSSVGAVSSYTFTNVTQDHTIYATFIIEDNGTYDLRDIGPAGGYIFYDKGSYSDGWRYLEAAPVSTEWTPIKWGSYGTLIGGTETGVGTGQSNTTKIVTWLNNNTDDTYGDVTNKTDRAAYLCFNLVYDGYNDWFLPSRDELNLIYINLKCFAVGGFTIGYWSSSEYDAYYAWYMGFGNGDQLNDSKNYTARVRAVRAF